MFDRLIDQIGQNLYGNTRLRYTDIVDTFKMKYPQVRVVQQWGPDVPAVFLVWRDDDGIYTIDLYPSKKQAYEMVESVAIHHRAGQVLAKAFFEEFSKGGWKLRDDKLIADLKAEGPQYCFGHILNWGIFGYECKWGPGEFCCNGYGFSKNFVDCFVLDEEKYLFDKRFWKRRY